MVISNQKVTAEQLMNQLPTSFTECLGDKLSGFNQVSSPDNATSASILFLSNAKAMPSGFKSAASIWVVGRKAKDAAVNAATKGQTILIANNVERAMAETIHAFFLQTPYTNRSIQGVHPKAVVSPTAKLGKNIRIGPNAFIGEHVELGDNVYVGANAVIEDQTVIGKDSVVHPLAFIGHSTLIGERCEIHPASAIGKEGYGYAHDELGNHYRIPHQGRVVLENDVHIGSTTAVDRSTFGETRIKQGAKLDNKIHIAHNCEIGKNALLTSGFAIAGSTKIGANFITGGNSTVTGHIEVCDNVQLAGESVISKSILKPGQYAGYPLQPLQQALKTKVATTHLVEMQKELRIILKHLGLSAKTSRDGTEAAD